MRLHTFSFSPNPLKVRMALAELALPYESLEVDVFRGAHLTEVFAEINPQRRVPVLEDEGLRLRESNAILTYLGRKHPGGLWPRELAAEALALQWLFFEAVHLATPSRTVWWSETVAPKLQRPSGDALIVANAIRTISEAYDAIEHHLTARDHMLGDAFTLVDCALGVTIASLRGTTLDDPSRWPHVVAYRERVRSRSSWQQAAGDAIYDFG